MKVKSHSRTQETQFSSDNIQLSIQYIERLSLSPSTERKCHMVYHWFYWFSCNSLSIIQLVSPIFSCQLSFSCCWGSSLHSLSSNWSIKKIVNVMSTLSLKGGKGTYQHGCACVSNWKVTVLVKPSMAASWGREEQWLGTQRLVTEGKEITATKEQ